MNIDPLLYLVAHAPAKPWPSFKPQMRAKPEPQPIPTVKKVGLGPDNKIINYRDASLALEEEANHVRTANHQAKVDWEKEYDLQARVQWPLYWANLMLGQLRKEFGHEYDAFGGLRVWAPLGDCPVSQSDED